MKPGISTTRITVGDLETSSARRIAAALDPQGNTAPLPKVEVKLAYKLPMRLDFTVGRMVKVNAARNMDVGRAFRALDGLVKRNRIKAEFMRQRFHERPGLKRKRIKRERWRKHFKEGFKGMIALVKKMKKQGW